jgi:hypothetical protein
MLSVAEARVLVEDYRRHDNEERPHGGIGYRTPVQARTRPKLLTPVALRAPSVKSLNHPIPMLLSKLNPNLTLVLDHIEGLDHDKKRFFEKTFLQHNTPGHAVIATNLF